MPFATSGPEKYTTLKSKASSMLDLQKAAEFITENRRDLLSDDNRLISLGIFNIASCQKIDNGKDLVWFIRIIHLAAGDIGIELEKSLNDIVFLIESETDHVCASPYYEIFISDVRGDISEEEEERDLKEIFTTYIDIVNDIQISIRNEMERINYKKM